MPAATGNADFDIKRLNKRVEAICQKKIKEAKSQNIALHVDVATALKKGNDMIAGAPVYRVRFEWLVYVYCLMGLALLGFGVVHRGLWRVLLYLVLMFVAYDFYSGLLHIVLDNPENIALPFIGQPCLEFQWHHYIPSDITDKSLGQACGDLNFVIFLLASIHIVWSSDWGANETVLALAGCKLFAAYFGQFSHRSAHDALAGPFVKTLQKNGIMITAREHKIHHTAPHDKDFCLIGMCNPVFDYLTENVASPSARYVWLSCFLAWTILDILLLANMMDALVGTGQ